MTHKGTISLDTERLILRRFTVEDAEAMFRNWCADPDVTKYLMWPTHGSIEESRKVLQDIWISHYDGLNFYQWAIEVKDIHEPIGSIGVVKSDDKRQMVHIGYCIGKAWWHKGYTSEALIRLVRFFFEDVGVNLHFDEFSSLLLQHGVTVKESRGRFSYLTPDRTKPITARKLGDDFYKAAVLAACAKNAEKAVKEERPILSPTKAGQAVPQKKGVQRMVDIEAKRTEGKGIGYENWAKVFNFKQMAATHNFLVNNDYLDRDKLDEAIDKSYKTIGEKLTAVKDLEKQIAAKTELRRVVSDYRRSKPTVDEGRKPKDKKAEQYRASHEADYIIHEAALRRLRELVQGNRLPYIKTLNAEINALISEKNAAYNEYHRAHRTNTRF